MSAERIWVWPRLRGRNGTQDMKTPGVLSSFLMSMDFVAVNGDSVISRSGRSTSGDEHVKMIIWAMALARNPSRVRPYLMTSLTRGQPLDCSFIEIGLVSSQAPRARKAVVQVLAHARQIVDNVDPKILQPLRLPDPGQLKQLWRADRSRRDDHFGAGGLPLGIIVMNRKRRGDTGQLIGQRRFNQDVRGGMSSAAQRIARWRQTALEPPYPVGKRLSPFIVNRRRSGTRQMKV